MWPRNIFLQAILTVYVIYENIIILGLLWVFYTLKDTYDFGKED
jgi:hypothetical protein